MFLLSSAQLWTCNYFNFFKAKGAGRGEIELRSRWCGAVKFSGDAPTFHVSPRDQDTAARVHFKSNVQVVARKRRRRTLEHTAPNFKAARNKSSGRDEGRSGADRSGRWRGRTAACRLVDEANWHRIMRILQIDHLKVPPPRRGCFCWPESTAPN